MALTSGEQGFLLLASHLGDPERKCLTPAQFRELARRVSSSKIPTDLRQLEPRDLTALGYSRPAAAHIVALLEQELLLRSYLRRAEALDCRVMTRLSPDYPHILREKLGQDAPVCLWYRGDPSLLRAKRISLVGNRTLRPANEEFAALAGRQAAAQGYVLVSGNARGADRTAQQACLQAGGEIIRIVADDLSAHSAGAHTLSISEDSFDLPFSPLRALSRNRIIHALSPAVLVAQCDETRGGTWDGSQRNLRSGWSNLCCFRESTPGIQTLIEMGARAVNPEELSDFSLLCERAYHLFAF